MLIRDFVIAFFTTKLGSCRKVDLYSDCSVRSHMFQLGRSSQLYTLGEILADSARKALRLDMLLCDRLFSRLKQMIVYPYPPHLIVVPS
jgi:hypothetical protein